MPSSALDDALSSKQPSSLSAASLSLVRQKEQLRLNTGRHNIKLSSARGDNHQLQKQYSLAIPAKKPPSPSPPPLEGSVQLLPGAEGLEKTSLFSQGGPLDLGTKDQESTMAPSKTITVRTIEGFAKPTRDGQHISMKTDEWQQVLGAIKGLKEDRTELTAKVASLTQENKKLAGNSHRLAKDVETLEAEVETLEAEVANQAKTTAKQKKKAGQKANRKDEQADDVVNTIEEYVKMVQFRTTKFALPGKQLEMATKQVWEGIKDRLQLEKGPNGLTVTDFVEIYDSVVLSALSDRRQYMQTRCKLAAQEWLEENNGQLPTVEEIENVWNLPEPTKAPEGGEESKEDKKARLNSPEQKKYDRAVKILVWWMDSFMPYAVGLECWGPNIRPFHKMTDKQFIEGDVSGKEKVLVTTTSEAFAYLLYANCRDKWIADYAYLKTHKKNKKATVPRYKKNDPETHKHQNKWSNANSGNVPGGGWHLDALKYFNKQMKAVKEYREKEEKAGFPNYTLVQHLIKINNDINMEEDGDSATKKRKREESQPDKSVEVIDLMFIDE